MAGKKYTLTYFNLRGRAEIPRLIFAATGTPYEDKRIPFGEEWTKLKPKTPSGFLPLLEFDGKVIDQSMTIARFLSKELGLHGKDNYEQALVESMMDLCNDLFNTGVTIHFEKDEERKKSLQTKMASETMPKFIETVVKFMTKYGKNGFLVGSSLTTADLALYDVMTMYKDMKAHEKDPKIAAHFKKIEETPKIKEWIAKRPATEG